MNGDFQSTLNNLLSNPEALRGLMSIASTMMGASSQTSADASPQSSASSPLFGGASPQASSSASSPMFGGASPQSSLGASSPTFAQASSGDPSSLDASTFAELARRIDDKDHHQTGEPTHCDSGGQHSSISLDKLLSLSPKSSKNDPRCTLLYALKPYLSPTRRDKVDSLVKAIQLVSLASGLFGGKLF